MAMYVFYQTFMYCMQTTIYCISNYFNNYIYYCAFWKITYLTAVKTETNVKKKKEGKNYYLKLKKTARFSCVSNVTWCVTVCRPLVLTWRAYLMLFQMKKISAFMLPNWCCPKPLSPTQVLFVPCMKIRSKKKKNCIFVMIYYIAGHRTVPHSVHLRAFILAIELCFLSASSLYMFIKAKEFFLFSLGERKNYLP